MDERRLFAAIRYAPMNPVRAGLAARAADWRWSSVDAHLARRDDEVVTVAPILDRVGDFAAFVEAADDGAAVTAIRMARTNGRPVGAKDWIAALRQASSVPSRRANAGAS